MHLIKKTFLTSCVLLTCSANVSLANPQESEAKKAFFQRQQEPLTGKVVPFSAEDLCSVATETQNYLSLGRQYDPYANHSGIFKTFGISLYRVKKTLDFICQVSLEDSQKNQSSRLQDPAFLQAHFDIIRWKADQQQARQFEQQKTLLKRLPKDKILLTKYYIKKAEGSLTPTTAKPFALYALPHDEKDLSLQQAQQQKSQLTRFNFTKQDILNGALDKKHLAKPLVYLSREALEDTLMQGTVLVEYANTDNPLSAKQTMVKSFFNVHRNNNHAYDRNISKEEQKRYWYFKKTPGVMGYGKDANHKITVQPQVTVAGDLALLGLGKLILITTQSAEQKTPQHRLAILADTGGAFENNRYQLDFLSGFYTGWKDYHQHWKILPDYAEARILILKENKLQSKKHND